MSIEAALDPSGRFVLLTYGDADPAPGETQETILRVLSDPKTPADAGLLIDRRSVKETPSAERVRQLTTALGRQTELFRGRRVAVVYSGGLATYGLLRMAQTLSAKNPSTLEGFTSMEEAVAWLTSARD